MYMVAFFCGIMMKNNLIIYYAIILQAITVLFLLTSPVPILVASLGVFYKIFMIPQIGALLMLLSIILATIGLFVKTQSRLHFLFFIPQYLFLLLTAGSALNYVFEGHYADGVIRPWQFIFIDQIHSMILAFLYTSSIFRFRKENNDTAEAGKIINKK